MPESNSLQLFTVSRGHEIDYLTREVAEDAMGFQLLRDRLLQLQSQYEDPYTALEDESVRWTITQMYGRLKSVLFPEKLLTAEEILADYEIVIPLFWSEDSPVLKNPSPQGVVEDPEIEPYMEEPSSGDYFADLMARLILVDGTVEGARTLLRSHSIQTLNAMTKQLNELRKPHQERLNDAKAKYFAETYERAQTSDRALYRDLMGLGEAKPL